MNDSCNQMMACITINERVCLKSNNQYYIFLFFPLYLLFADSYIIAASFSCWSVTSLFYYNNYQKYIYLKYLSVSHTTITVDQQQCVMKVNNHIYGDIFYGACTTPCNHVIAGYRMFFML